MKTKIPHTYVLLISLTVLAAILTWVVPAGRYERAVDRGRTIIDPASFHAVQAQPAGIFEVLLAFPKALVEVADIIFYIFIIGGTFGVLNRTGLIQGGIQALVKRIGGRQALIVPVLTLVFAIGGGTIGIAEETLVFLPALLLLARSLGYDSLTAGGIALVGANARFAAAFMNPFTVGVARGALVILRDANVIDSMTHAMAAVVGRWSFSISVIGIYIMQNLLHFIVPSGRGQAAVSMPILAPLGDLVGITRQTNVLAYQLGNGLTNVFIPTQGYFMAALGILKIPWEKWVRWLLPLLLIWLALGMAAVVIAQALHLGPF